MSLPDDSDDDRGPGHSRRWFLVGGAAAVTGAGIGVGAGFLQPVSTPKPRPAPHALTEAIDAEQGLLVLATAAVRRDPTLRADVVALVSDHTAHLRALRSAATAFDPAHVTPAPAPTFATTSSVRAELRAAERAAATAATARAARLTGPTAVLLASIAACESTHAELLT